MPHSHTHTSSTASLSENASLGSSVGFGLCSLRSLGREGAEARLMAFSSSRERPPSGAPCPWDPDPGWKELSGTAGVSRGREEDNARA